MSKFKQVKPDVWSAHIQRATSSPHLAKEYKRSTYKVNTHNIMAKRIKNGEEIGESWLKGRLKQELLDLTDITEQDFEKYYPSQY